VNLFLGQEQLDRIHDILTVNLIESGVRSVILIDTAGNIIVSIDNGSDSLDICALAALAAANFGAMSSMASIVGEDEFSLLFHKGQKDNIFFSKVSDDFLLINIFSNHISLGLLRLKMTKIIEEIISILI
jgi:predicted regulator of Ras-like GTPase activity (Roadblock/LC7/MglB family)